MKNRIPTVRHIRVVSITLLFLFALAACPDGDANSSDAGAVSFDAGDIDGGVAQDDAGTGHDAGSDDLHDAGTNVDAGPGDNGDCAAAVDDDLGSLVLVGGTKVGAVDAITGIGAFAFDGANMYGNNGVNGSIVVLGTWPNISITTMSGSLIDPDNDYATNYLGDFLIFAEGNLLAGYTGPAFMTEGILTQHNISSNVTTYVPAPGVYSASAHGDVLLVNSLGLDGVDEGPGVYRKDASGTRRWIDFDSEFNASSTVTQSDDGLLGIGFYDGNIVENRFFVHAGGLDPTGTTSISNGFVEVPSPVYQAQGLTDSIATLSTSYGESGLVLEGLARHRLDQDGVLQTQDILTAQENSCETVSYFSHIGEDLVLRVHLGDGKITWVRIALTAF